MSEIQFDLARTLLQKGQIDRAIEACKRSLTYKEDPNVKRTLKKLETQLERTQLIARGDQALDAGQYAKALADYQDAARLAGDTGEEAKLLELAVAGFTAQLDDEERKDDAQFGIDQLEVVASRYLK